MSQVCSRCCLRYAGVRSGTYATRAPITSLLCEVLELLSAASLAPQPPGEPATAEATPAIAPATAVGAQHPTADVPAATEMTVVEAEAGVADAQAEPQAAEAKIGLHGAEGDAEPLGPLGVGSGEGGAGEEGQAICRVCLGVLQSLDGPLGGVSEELRGELSDRDGGGSPWSPVARGNVDSIADHVRCAFASGVSARQHHDPIFRCQFCLELLL